ncbi:conserved hypothetical protein [Culex quinquefasciatus]|uniref:Fatty acyl-CoA reductase n=1 Tax=Culex quinquefasciatus TaxID=7176 RepID=B0XKM4_CULQU|nr:conserved hypothetical protein [Culex quinquefasciatus]|eukprot:XP_001870196.1 conserved hypothetical protein [Culex quinquefasciatus]
MSECEVMLSDVSLGEYISVPRFYAGADVFLTGGTGFMGKVLIEKLLRSCPDVGRIFVLMRSKRGKTPQTRVQDLTNNPVGVKITRIEVCGSVQVF